MNQGRGHADVVRRHRGQPRRGLIAQESAEIDSSILGAAISAAGEVAPKVEGRIKRLDP